MKKITKAFLIILLSLIMCMTSVPAFASEAVLSKNTGVMPRLSHLTNSNFYFSATSNGGYATVSYEGYDSFAKATITIKVQKRFLFVFWNDVSEWSSSSTEINDEFYHVFALNGSGTYKATFTLTITGTDGTVDTIEQVIESKY